MSPGFTGLLLGLLGGGGLVCAVAASPPMRRPTLDQRLAPYLRDTPRPSRLLVAPGGGTPFRLLRELLAPGLADAATRLERLLGGAASIRRRLEQLGRGGTVEELRVEQVVWGGLALLGVLASTAGLALLGRPPAAVPAAAVAVAAAVGGVLGRDWWLSAEVRRRERRMLAEFGTVADLLALAVSAGEGAAGALARVSRLPGGELPREFARALAETRSGVPLVPALDGIGRRTGLPELARFVDGVTVAIERGTPLADVLREQAVDVREAGRRRLLEAGGRREIAMMVPVVFLVLPVTVVFALFPALVRITGIAS